MQTFLRNLLIITILTYNFPVLAETPPVKIKKYVNRFVTDSVLKHASISFKVTEVKTGKTLASYHANQSLATASTLKILTTTTALELLGRDFRFKTILEYEGTILPNGELAGNLFLTGKGDPTLASKHFPEDVDIFKRWIEELTKNNIKNINGAIISDESYFKPDLPRTWIWEDIANYYAAAAHGLSYKDNLFTLSFKSDSAGKLTDIIDVSPKIKGIKFKNKVLSSVKNRDNAYLFGCIYSNVRHVEGTVPENKENFKVKGATPNPSLLLAEEFTNYLQKSGISISSKPERIEHTNLKNPRKSLFIHHSPTLEQIIFEINQKSINLFSEHLLKKIGKHSLDEGSTNFGIKALKNFWEDKGIDTSGAFLYDGCGLSRFNAVSSNFLNEILIYMYKSPNFDVFYNSLPLAGKSGTLKNFGKNTPLENNLKAKTGSITKVRSLSGYMKTQKGKFVAFTLIINNYSCSLKVLSKKMTDLLVEIYKNN